MTRAARIQITEQCLLTWFQFPEGRIWAMQWDEDYRRFECVIEHPDLPEVEQGKAIQVVLPAYTSHFGDDGNLVAIERTDPPKVAT